MSDVTGKAAIASSHPETQVTTYLSVEPLPGRPCPVCRRKMPMTGAQRQAKWRAAAKPRLIS